ncbi:MAG TPA: anthranilate phosphoribosyltransferase [Trueperaceae bacterium]|nr:anthranilate phosphoribosyltransferase [Trueperaceae bacterium]
MVDELNRVFEGETLSQKEAKELIGLLMDGKLSQVQAAALLAALRTRGETVDEIVGFAQAMRERAIPLKIDIDEPLLDIVGTGGTGINTFNVSTTSIFVVASAGVIIAKHGNRGATRKSGSADVLEALGANLNQSPEQLLESLEKVGLAFIFARAHHPAMKFVAPIRSDLKARTIFNSLGPLTNPANAKWQLMGVYDPKLTETLAKVLQGLGLKRALVVHGDGLDEMSVSGETIVSELKDNQILNYTVKPEDFGLGRYELADVLGSSPSENAKTIRSILAGETSGAKRDIILLNSGAALYLVDKAPSIKAGVDMARELIDSGSALAKLEEYVSYNKGI